MSQGTPKAVTKQLQEVNKLFDSNDYTRGLKVLNKMQKQYPKVAEIAAWKGVFLQFLKKPTEAIELITGALRSDMKNPNIWRLNGVVYREQANYMKAMQCFTQSYKLDSSDDNVLLELCNLYLYERNYSTFFEYSKKILSSSTIPSSVIRFALALELNGRAQKAVEFLGNYESHLMPTTKDEEKLFRNEITIYHADLLISLENYQECIDYLTKSERIVDKAASQERLVKCYAKTGNTEKLKETLMELISRYPENGEYFDELEKITPNYIDELFSIKDKHKSRYAEVRILELMDVNDPRFEELLKTYLVPYLIKGAPAIYITIEDLSPEKIDLAIKVAKEANVPITSIPIVKNFIAQVMHSRCKYTEALQEIDEAIKHTPTCLDARATKVRILRRAGKINEAVEAAAALAEGDPADRNTNLLYANILMANGQLQTAVTTAAPFSVDYKQRPKILCTEFNDFHVRAGDCAYLAGDFEMALKFYQDSIKFFEDFRASQFNYLSWGMRYIVELKEMLEWADDLINHHLFSRAAVGIIKINLINNNLKDIAPLCLRITRAKDPTALAYAAAYYAKLKDPLPAIKCIKKINGSLRFAVIPSLKILMKSISSLPPLVQEVANEECNIPTIQPASFTDYVSAARGELFVSEVKNVKPLLTKAVSDFDYTFKEARDVYTLAKNEMKDDDLAQFIIDKIHSKYPDYQILQKSYEKPDNLPPPPPEDD